MFAYNIQGNKEADYIQRSNLFLLSKSALMISGNATIGTA